MTNLNKRTKYKNLISKATRTTGQDAIKLIDQAININPNWPEAYNIRHWINFEIGNTDQSLIDHDKFMDMDGVMIHKDALYGDYKYRNQDIQEKIKNYNEEIANNPGNAHLYYERGRAYMAGGDYNAAMHDILSCINIEPDHALAYCRRGEIKLTLGDNSGAEVDFKESISLCPSNPHPYYHLAHYYLSVNNEKAAIKLFLDILKLNPQNWNVLGCLGSVYMQKEDYKTAAQYYTDVIKINPVLIEAYENRACCYEKLGENELAEKDNEMVELLREEERNIKNNHISKKGAS